MVFPRTFILCDAMGPACATCHSSKVKCVRSSDNEDDACDRCQRLDLECVPHHSRQGKGPRRNRKKIKTAEEEAAAAATVASSTVAAALFQQISSMNMNAQTTMRQTSVGSSSVSSQHSNYSGLQNSLPTAFVQVNNAKKPAAFIQDPIISNRPTTDCSHNTAAISSGIEALQVEDEIVCSSIHGMDYNHFGLHHLIRMWVSLSLTRRSFNLLARASFVAAKCGMSMDDILSNKSPYAIVTSTPPMTWLSINILCPREQQSTLGPRVKLQEVPWDLLKAVHIDLTTLIDRTLPFQRWAMIRWNTKGKSRFWASPFFERDFASVDEIEQVWVENKMEVIDLFLPKSEKKKFATAFFNLLYLYKEPNMACYVTRQRTKVQPRNTKQLLDATLITTYKIIDLETSLHYHEIRFDVPQDNNNNNNNNTASSAQGNEAMLYNLGNTTSSVNKRNNREMSDQTNNKIDNDPLMDGDLEFTDVNMTDELEEWMNMFDDPFATMF